MLIPLRIIKETQCHNWDDDNGLPVSIKDWELIDSMSQMIINNQSQLGIPWFCGCGDGSAHARWYNNSRTKWAEVEILNGKPGITFSKPINGLYYHDFDSLDLAINAIYSYLI